MDDQRKQTDSLGRIVYTRKSTQSEIDRRNAWVAKLHKRGHSTMEIAVALDINNDTVRQGMRDLGIPRTNSPKGAGWVNESCPWRDDDIPLAERERPCSTGHPGLALAAVTDHRHGADAQRRVPREQLRQRPRQPGH